MEYVPVMVAEHEIPLIVGAYQMGIRDYDIDLAYEAVRKMQTVPGRTVGGGFAGNRDLEAYLKYKYVPSDEGRFSNTLEYSYDDWTVSQFAKALDKSILRVEDAVMETLSQTPPELAADIYNTGIYLAGGGSMLRGLDRRLSQKTDLPVYIAEDPLRAVVRGTGIALKNLERYKSIREGIESALPARSEAPYWLATLRYGELQGAAIVKWCDETLTLFEELGAGSPDEISAPDSEA